MVNDLLETFELESRCLIKSSSRIFAKEYVEEGVPFFRSKDVIDKALGVFSGYDLFISSERYEELKESHGSPSKGDLLISSVGNRSGQPYVVQDEGDFYFKDGNIIWISDFKDIDSNFLAYWFKSNIGQSRLASVMIGSAQKALTINSIRTLTVTFPTFEAQKAIAHILGSLDDKIELNRQMNKTLESMAQALFKSWFVDFDPVIDNALAAGNPIPDELLERAEQRRCIEKKDNSDIQDLFPDEFEFTEEMGWVPKGWEVGRYSDLAELNPQSWNKKSMPEEISYVDLGNTNNGKIDLVVSYSSSEAPSRAKRVLSTDDTIIGTVRPGNRSFAFIHNEGLTGSTGFAVMKPIESINRTYIYLGLTQSIVIDYFAHIADGGAYPAINPSVVADLECIIPPSEVLEKFDNLAYRFMKKNGENNNHSKTLAKLRDTLLPKLMSGELRIPDAAALVDEVI